MTGNTADMWWADINNGFEPGHLAPDSETGEALWFAFAQGEIVVTGASSGTELPVAASSADLGIEPVCRPMYLGRLNGQDLWGADIGDAPELPPRFSTCHPRTLFGEVEDALFAMAGRAFHLIQWDRNSRFCGRCGVRNTDWEQGRAKVCPECKHLVFPRISPAVIVAVRRGNRLLLGRNQRRPGAMFSIIAGFVEPGENLEEAVRRELHEEVGIEVTNIRYFGSQPWPFPDSLMLGFQADYLAGDIQLTMAKSPKPTGTARMIFHRYPAPSASRAP